jgi:hypothetical protein
MLANVRDHRPTPASGRQCGSNRPVLESAQGDQGNAAEDIRI